MSAGQTRLAKLPNDLLKWQRLVRLASNGAVLLFGPDGSQDRLLNRCSCVRASRTCRMRAANSDLDAPPLPVIAAAAGSHFVICIDELGAREGKDGVVVELSRWEEIGEMACGLWLMISPYIFGYAGTVLEYWHLGLGVAVILLAMAELRQDRKLSDRPPAEHGQK